MALIKTGEVFFRDEDGAQWLSESYEDDETHEVTTQQMQVEPPPPQPPDD